MREAIQQDAQLANAGTMYIQHRQVNFNEGDQVWLTLGTR